MFRQNIMSKHFQKQTWFLPEFLINGTKQTEILFSYKRDGTDTILSQLCKWNFGEIQEIKYTEQGSMYFPKIWKPPPSSKTQGDAI
jgi:hypothetical protein